MLDIFITSRARRDFIAPCCYPISQSRNVRRKLNQGKVSVTSSEPARFMKVIPTSERQGNTRYQFHKQAVP